MHSVRNAAKNLFLILPLLTLRPMDPVLIHHVMFHFIRVCSKTILCQLYGAICGKSVPHEGGAADRVSRIRDSCTADWDVQSI